MSEEASAPPAQDTAPSGFLPRLADRPRIRALALAGTVIATVYLLWHSDEPSVVGDDAEELRGKAEPDGFIVNGHYVSYDDKGRPEVRFSSPRIEQFDSSGLATMVAPEAELYGEPESRPWTVSADNGSLLRNENLLYLTGNVHMVQSSGDRNITLTTQTLTLDNDTGTAYTDAPVEITDATGTTRATGMTAWLNKRVLELNSQVEGRYETGK